MTRQELRDYVDEQRTLNNIPYHVYSTLIDGIDTLEQEPILDKIRAEIKALTSNRGFLSCSVDYIHEEIDAVFDKYKVESEE